MKFTTDYIPSAWATEKDIPCAVDPAPAFFADGKPQYEVRGLLFILGGRRRGMYWTPAYEVCSNGKTYLLHAHQVAGEEYGARTRYVHIAITVGGNARISSTGKHVSESEAQECLQKAKDILKS